MKTYLQAQYDQHLIDEREKTIENGSYYSHQSLVSPHKTELERLQWLLNHGDCDEAYNARLCERIAKLTN